jgi:hypothetical protein
VFVKPLDTEPVSDIAWGRWLKEAEGVPGRAICLEYACRIQESAQKDLGRCDSLYESLGAVSQLICQGEMSVQWWDATETLLETHKTALFQLKYRCAVKASTLRDRIACLVDASFYGRKRALGNNLPCLSFYAFCLRSTLRRHDMHMASREEYEPDVSWERMHQIREAQMARFAHSSGHETSNFHFSVKPIVSIIA